MSESMYKNNELINEVSSDMSCFWYSDVVRVEERGNVLASQAIVIDSRSKLQKWFFQTGYRHSQVQGTIRQQVEMCSPE